MAMDVAMARAKAQVVALAWVMEVAGLKVVDMAMDMAMDMALAMALEMDGEVEMAGAGASKE